MHLGEHSWQHLGVALNEKARIRNLLTAAFYCGDFRFIRLVILQVDFLGGVSLS